VYNRRLLFFEEANRLPFAIVFILDIEQLLFIYSIYMNSPITAAKASPFQPGVLLPEYKRHVSIKVT